MINLLETYMSDPLDPIKNFYLGYEYEKIGQTASAVSFYIRAAEKSDDSLLKFESMIRASKCFDAQGKRNFSTKGLLQFAITVEPNRCEGYYFLSKLYHKMEKWRECSLYAQLGMQYDSYDDLRTDIDFPGKFGLIYEKAVGDWYIGLYEKSKQALYDLKYNIEMDSKHEDLVQQMLDEKGYPDSIPYNKKTAASYKFTFDGIESVSKNYSKHMQDMFVLTALNGKRNGTYLEIGAGDPIHNNNTYLLEKDFNWKGISVENNRDYCNQFFSKRSNPIVKKSATELDYYELLEKHCMPFEIDYLSIDCDENSYEALRRIPFDDYKFAVIHFEHDFYINDSRFREYSRNILKEKGYTLIVNDIAINEKDNHEDWWVHTDLVDQEIIQKLKAEKPINFVGTYMFKHKKKIKTELNKMKGFVPNILSLKSCEDRRKILDDIFNKNHVHVSRMNIFNRVQETDLQFRGNENYIKDIPLLGILSSHVLTIKRWYEETSDDYGLFFEDDVSFDNNRYWNFTLQEFVNKLPNDWSAIQLSGVFQVDPDIRVRERHHLDHGIQAYILKREYAKKLLGDLLIGDKVFSIKEPYQSLSIENFIMNDKYGKVYIFPLFNHNINENFVSTVVSSDDGTKNIVNGQSHLAKPSYDTIYNWWKNIGSKLSLDEIMEL